MTERELQANIIQAAHLLGWMTYHVHDSRRSAPGFPDLVCVRERVLWAELKSDTGQLRPEQTVWIKRLQDAGQEVHVFRPRNWISGEVEAVLGRKASVAA